MGWQGHPDVNNAFVGAEKVLLALAHLGMHDWGLETGVSTLGVKAVGAPQSLQTYSGKICTYGPTD